METETAMIFKKGEQASPSVFIGTAWVNMLVSDSDAQYDCQVYDVLFEAAARNNWHSHPGGQILLVTAGEGYYQERDKPAQLLHQGDVVEIPPNVVHWHGATAESTFSHIGISPKLHTGAANWLEPVTEAHYKQLTQTTTK